MIDSVTQGGLRFAIEWVDQTAPSLLLCVFSCASVLSWHREERWPEVTVCSDSSDHFEIPNPLNLKGQN